MELNFENVRWQQYCLHYVQIHKPSAQTCHFVQRVNDGRANHVHPKGRRGRKKTQPLHPGQNIKHNVKTMSFPEEVVGFFADDRMGEHKDDDHGDQEQHTSQTGQRLEQPIKKSRLSLGKLISLDRHRKCSTGCVET